MPHYDPEFIQFAADNQALVDSIQTHLRDPRLLTLDVLTDIKTRAKGNMGAVNALGFRLNLLGSTKAYLEAGASLPETPAEIWDMYRSDLKHL